MLDRCGIGTLLWSYSAADIQHPELFRLSAEELVRPVRTRSLAPRNFQNVMISYGHLKMSKDLYRGNVITALASRMPDLLDHHDPGNPKLEVDVLFSYTCKEGTEVRADAFRVSMLGVFLKYLLKLPFDARSAAVNKLITSMCCYVERAIEWAQAIVFEPRDAVQFLVHLGLANKRGIPAARTGLETLAFAVRELCQRLSYNEVI